MARLALLVTFALSGCYDVHRRSPAAIAPAFDAGVVVARDAPAADDVPAVADAPIPSDVPPSCAETWALGSDFSTERNPAGPWAYGWERGDAVFERGTAISVEAMEGWAGPSPAGPERFPYVLCNTSGAPTRYQGRLPYDAGACGMHPAPACERAILRWTAPEAGEYAFVADATSIDMGRPSADVRVAGLAFGTGVLGPPLHAVGVASLDLGQTIDLAIGCGPDGSHAYDSVRVAMSVCRLR